MPSQDVIDHSHKGHSAFGNAGKRDSYLAGSGGAGASEGFAGRRKAPMRPSMELRCKQLDLSLLQANCLSAHQPLPLHYLLQLKLSAAAMRRLCQGLFAVSFAGIITICRPYCCVMFLFGLKPAWEVCRRVVRLWLRKDERQRVFC